MAKMQKKFDAVHDELRALKTYGVQGQQRNRDTEGDKGGAKTNLDKLYKWAQSCKTEWGEESTEYHVANEKYQGARQEKDKAKPHSIQLSQARIAKEKLEKEIDGIGGEIQHFEKQLADAKERLAKKEEQAEVARAREQELKVQGVDASAGFLSAMQKQYEKAVDGSGVTTEEYALLFNTLGKVMANAKEDVPMGPPPDGAAGTGGGKEGGGDPVAEEGPKISKSEQEWLKAGGIPQDASEDHKKRWMEICADLAVYAAKRQKRS